MSLTKIDIVESVYTHIGIPQKKCASIVESLFDIIKDEMSNGDDVMISGFGKWTVLKKKERKGRNPKTGTAMMITARKVLTFKSSSSLKKALAR